MAAGSPLTCRGEQGRRWKRHSLTATCWAPSLGLSGTCACPRISEHQASWPPLGSWEGDKGVSAQLELELGPHWASAVAGKSAATPSADGHSPHPASRPRACLCDQKGRNEGNEQQGHALTAWRSMRRAGGTQPDGAALGGRGEETVAGLAAGGSRTEGSGGQAPALPLLGMGRRGARTWGCQWRTRSLMGTEENTGGRRRWCEYAHRVDVRRCLHACCVHV